MYIHKPLAKSIVSIFGSNPGTWSKPSGMTKSLFERPQIGNMGGRVDHVPLCHGHKTTSQVPVSPLGLWPKTTTQVHGSTHKANPYLLPLPIPKWFCSRVLAFCGGLSAVGWPSGGSFLMATHAALLRIPAFFCLHFPVAQRGLPDCPSVHHQLQHRS